MTHHVFTVDGRDKAEIVRQLVEGEGRTVAFTRTKHGAKNLARRLTLAGIPAVDLHGNLSQAVRQKNLSRFSSGRVRVLVATDIAARGIHVDDVNLVVHVDPPAEHKAYVHRSGRTARAGNEGVVVTVATQQQNGSVRSLMRLAGIKPITRPVTPGHRAITELVGPSAPRVEPSLTPEPAAEPQRRPRHGGSGGRSAGRPAYSSGGRGRSPRAASPDRERSSAERSSRRSNDGRSNDRNGASGSSSGRPASGRPDSNRTDTRSSGSSASRGTKNASPSKGRPARGDARGNGAPQSKQRSGGRPGTSAPRGARQGASSNGTNRRRSA
jgi:superfamily II DNA/RNA helicase